MECRETQQNECLFIQAKVPWTKKIIVFKDSSTLWRVGRSSDSPIIPAIFMKYSDGIHFWVFGKTGFTAALHKRECVRPQSDPLAGWWPASPEQRSDGAEWYCCRPISVNAILYRTRYTRCIYIQYTSYTFSVFSRRGCINIMKIDIRTHLYIIMSCCRRDLQFGLEQIRVQRRSRTWQAAVAVANHFFIRTLLKKKKKYASKHTYV